MKKHAWALALAAFPLAPVWAQADTAAPAPVEVPAADSAVPLAPADPVPAPAPVAAAPALPPEPVATVAPDAPAAPAAPAPVAAPTPSPAPVAVEETYPDMTKAGSAIAKRFYVSPLFDYTFSDKDRHADNGLGGRLVIGKQIADGFNIEIGALYERYSGKSRQVTSGGLLPTTTTVDGGKEELTGGNISALVFPSTTLSGLYGVASVGYAKGKSSVATTPDSSKNSTVWDAGLGYLLGPWAWLNDGSLRLEARYQADEKKGGAKNDFLEPVLSAGLLIPLGAAPKKPEPAPVPVAVVPVVTPPDTDGDGVPDTLDQCPGTPAGTKVNDKGCPLPPPCKAPEPGQKIDLTGCGTGDSVVLQGVTFEFDKAKLTVNAKTILDGVVEALAAAPNIQFEIGGYTDSKGSDSYNQKLSERRAKSVADYLAAHGVAASRMTSAGYGETNPVADNATDEGRELNRRVELKVTGSTAAEAAPAAAPAAEPAPPAAPAAEPAATAEPAPAP